jgi:thiol:disulfide interchange protein DsbD
MHKRLLTLLAALGALVGALVAGATPEFLTPDQAFRVSATQAAPDRVQLTWKIEDGYYLYRSKLRVQSETPGVALGQPTLPPSEGKDDEFFGRVDIYRGEVTLAVPVEANGPMPESITLRALSQGCADAGLCYPPHQQTVRVAMAAASDRAAPVSAAAGGGERAAMTCCRRRRRSSSPPPCWTTPGSASPGRSRRAPTSTRTR